MTKALSVLVKVGIVALLGGSIYAAITEYINSSRGDALIESLRADNERINGLLDSAQSRITDLEGIVDEIGRSSEDLRERLARSEEIARGLRADNNRIAGELRRIRESAGKLGDENNRLRDAIGRGLKGAGSVAEAHHLLGEALERAIGIVGVLEKGIQ